jgi:asparagine synthase (glutamine-hydrolysing)
VCGIAGIWHRDGRAVDQALVRQMCDSLAHRGPDGDEGLLVDSHGDVQPRLLSSANGSADHDLAFGHRRLAIIDLATGDQPMSDASGSLWLIYNGEIYNYRELRAQLQAAGHQFRTQSDTEVILHAYQAYGVDCAAQLNGIFAFALWDAARERLYLARDHFGVKPLYYSELGGALRFASELKAILADPAVPRRPSLDALNLCLTLRHTPAPWTLFDGIAKLPPGAYAIVTRDRVEVTRYFVSAQPTFDDPSVPALVDELAERIDCAVKRQMVSDVPLSLSLSSGVDSSALLAIMAKHSSEPVRTFTVGFAGREADSEIGPATTTAHHFGACPTGKLISQDDYAAFMSRYMWHLEEPIGNDSAPAYYFVAQLAQANGIKVMLNGQGPDETFAGYDRHRGVAVLDRIAGLNNPLMRAGFAIAAGRLPQQPARLAHALSVASEVDQLLSIYTFVPPALRRRLLNPATQSKLNADLPRTYLAGMLGQAPPGTRLERMLWIDTRTSLPDNLLLAEDKMAMAASVEARVPFLDVELMAFAERVPGRLKLRSGQGKWLHRRACERFLPPDVIRRRKIGFDNALDLWLRARLGVELRDLMAEPSSLANSYLSRGTVDRLLDEHASGQHDHRRVLFLLLSLETWRRTFQVSAA